MIKQIFIAVILSLIFQLELSAQCTPDTSIQQPGVYPDSATGFMPGVVGIPYSQVIQLKVPEDTTVIIFGQPITIDIDSVQLTSFTGLPPGLSLSCNPASCTYPGGTNGCAVISGIPTDTGYFQLTGTVTTYAGGGTIPPQVNTVTYYSITITDPTGVNEFAGSGFMVGQNIPNPFNNTSAISYNIPHKGNVEFKVFNLLGKEVYKSDIYGNAGINTITLEAHQFLPGTYMYSITFNNRTITKSLVISER